MTPPPPYLENWIGQDGQLGDTLSPVQANVTTSVDELNIPARQSPPGINISKLFLTTDNSIP